MKKESFGGKAVFAALALFLVLGGGCKKGTSSPAGGDPALEGSVSIIGEAKVGAALSVDTASLDGLGTISCQWLRGDTADGDFAPIEGAAGETYLIDAADEGKYIKVTVARAGYSGSVISDPKGPVVTSLPPETEFPALTGSVSITGPAITGETLTASPQLEGEGGVSYQWQRGESADGEFAPIEGAIYETYLIDAADVGLWLRVSLVREGYSGSVESDPAGPVALPTLTGSVSITGEAVRGETLTASLELTASPQLEGEGGVSFQWLRGDTADGEFAPIEGAAGETYLIVLADKDKYIRVIVTREGYTGSITSEEPCGPVTLPPLPGSVSIIVNGEAAKVGLSLTVDTGQLGGTGKISYQWQRGAAADDEAGCTDIPGAEEETYLLRAADVDKYIRITVTRAGYSGRAASAAAGAVEKSELTGTVAISYSGGNVKTGTRLSVDITDIAGVEQLFYQWQKSDSANGTYNNIPGATGSAYIPENDLGKWIKVIVTQDGYEGEAASLNAAGPVMEGDPLEGPLSIQGVVKSGTPLTVDASGLNGQEDGELIYQWRISGSANGTYADIPEAAGASYTPKDADVGKFIKVIVRRNGYTGVRESPAAGPVAERAPLTGSVSIQGAAKSGTALSVNTDALGGIVALQYQWQISGAADGTYTNISGAAGKTYTPTDTDLDKYIRVVVTQDGYKGSKISDAVGPVGDRNPLTGSVSIQGAVKSGTALSVNTDALGGIVALQYQWQISAAADGTYTNISGAAGKTYTPTDTDLDKYIKVVVSQDGFRGSKISDAVGPVGDRNPLTGSVSIQGAAKSGTALSVNTDALGGIVPPLKYQWQISGAADGTYTNISGATNAAYTPQDSDVKKYIKVVVSQDGFRGSKISAAAGPVEDRHPLTGSVSITGAAKYGETLSVDISKLGGIVPPLKYQWQRSGSADGAYADIPGATNASYTLAAGDVRKYIKIVVGQYGFTGNVPCTAFGPVKPDVRSVTVKGPPVIKQNGSGTYTAVVEVLPNESQYKDVTWSIVAPGKTGITGVKNTAGYTVSPAMAASLGAVTIRAASSEDAQVTGDAPLNIKAFPVWAKADISWWPNNYITYNIAYGETAGNGRFVAGGDSGPSAYSTDGLNWWKGGEGFLYLRGIAFGNNRFVAVDYDGTSRWSTDGINWTNGNYTGVTVYEETATMGIAFGDGKFVVVGQFGKMAWSTDGVDWNPVSVTGFEASIIEGLHYAAAEIHDIVYANGRFVAVGGYGKAAYSGDGVTWTAVSNTTFSTSIITAITYGEVTDNEGQTQRRFVAASTGGKTAYSTDGVTWTAGGNPPGISYIADIAAGGGEFVAVSDNNMIAYSLDGIKWETSGNTVFQRIYAIAFGNGRFVVVTDKGIASYSP